MTIWDQLESDAAARLNGDAYFADPTKAAVLALAENRMDLLSELDRSLATLGAGLVVSVIDIQPSESDGEVEATLAVVAHEVPAINRDATQGGTGKTGKQLGIKAWSLLANWSPDEDAWAPLKFAGLSLSQVDEEHGRIEWTLQLKTRAFIDVENTVLGSEVDGPGAMELVDEHGAPLAVSPTEP